MLLDSDYEVHFMNFVYKPGSLCPLSPHEIAEAANKATIFDIYTPADFSGPTSRVSELKCRCNGFGEFELSNPQENEFRLFVKCRICGHRLPI